MFRSKILYLGLALTVAACGKHGKTAEGDKAASSAAQPSRTTVPSPPVATSTPAAKPPAFTIDSVPLSNAPLGAFPYFGLPAKYKPQNSAETRDIGQFPFWTGTELHQVEGKTYYVTIVGADEKDYSAYELKRNMEALFAQAGAVKITESKIPNDTILTLSEQQRSDIGTGFGDPYNNPVETWVIHRPNSEIWIHFSQNVAATGLAVVETKPFVATAALLPPETLKADLDKTGKAVIEVNFATDKADILPTSKPQMDAVEALLTTNPTLKLAINGYTDETGSDAHNLKLSDDRAKAVMAALVAAGTAPARLQAKGYGKSNPVATNGDAAGKAKNRRVELIRL